MAIGIIVAILIIIGIVVSFALGTRWIDNEEGIKGTVSFCICIALILAFIIVPFSFHTVQTGQIAVMKHLGKIQEVKTAGTYYDFWMTNKYVKYDTKVRNVETTAASYSADAQPMDTQMVIQYQIVADKVIDIATHYGSLETLENRITSIAIEKAKSVLASHKAMDIIANRAAMSPSVEEAIMNAVGEEYFVNIVAVVLTNIDFSDSFELAVEEKMIAEQNKLKAEYENETKVNAAAAEAEAKLRAARAEIDIAKAQAEVLKISAEAEAEANRIIEESITDKIIDKILADTWNGKLPNVVGDSNYVLPTEILN